MSVGLIFQDCTITIPSLKGQLDKAEVQVGHFNEPTSLPRSVTASLTLVFPNIQLIYHISAQEPTTSALQLLRHIHILLLLKYTSSIYRPRAQRMAPSLVQDTTFNVVTQKAKRNETRQKEGPKDSTPHHRLYHGTVFL